MVAPGNGFVEHGFIISIYADDISGVKPKEISRNHAVPFTLFFGYVTRTVYFSSTIVGPSVYYR